MGEEMQSPEHEPVFLPRPSLVKKTVVYLQSQRSTTPRSQCNDPKLNGILVSKNTDKFELFKLSYVIELLITKKGLSILIITKMDLI